MPPPRKSPPPGSRQSRNRDKLHIIDEENTSGSDTVTSDQEDNENKGQKQRKKIVTKKNAFLSNQMKNMNKTPQEDVQTVILNQVTAETLQNIITSVIQPLFDEIGALRQEIASLKQENKQDIKQMRCFSDEQSNTQANRIKSLQSDLKEDIKNEASKLTSLENMLREENVKQQKKMKTLEGIIKDASEKQTKNVKSIEATLREQCNKQGEKIQSLENILKIENEKQVKGTSSVEAKVQTSTAALTDKLTTLEGKLHHLEHIKVNIANIEKQNEAVNQQQTNKSYAEALNVKQTVQEVISQQSTRMRDQDSRKNNIVVFKLPEPATQSTDARIKHDTDMFREICKEVCKVEVQPADVCKVIRLGKKKDDENPRKMLVTLSNENLKRDIMRNLYKLKDAPEFYRPIRMNHDMSSIEREEAKKLFEECKRLQNQDQSGNWLYRVRGPPWARQIKKIKLPGAVAMPQ